MSVTVATLLSGRAIALVVISKVANNISASKTFSFTVADLTGEYSQRAFLRVDFPALVYPTNDILEILSLLLLSLWVALILFIFSNSLFKS